MCRICLIFLMFFVAISTCTARTIRTGTHIPHHRRADTLASEQFAERHAPDTLSSDRPASGNLDNVTAERNERLYDSIRTKTGRRAVPRLLYRLLFRGTPVDTMLNSRVVDESELLAPYAGKNIGRITIEREQVFDPKGNWFERTGNNLHALTRERVIRRDLLFGTGDRFDPQQLIRNKRLLLSRPYISDIEVIVRPDTVDTMSVDLSIRTRDSWTITVDGALHSEGHTMLGVTDANIFGTGNSLTINTNFSRKDFSYGGNVFEYRIPNVLGSFYTADLRAGRDFYNATLDVGFQKEFIRPTDYEVGLRYSNIKAKRYMVATDTALLVRARNLDAWAGYSRALRPIGSSVFLTARYAYARFGLRPEVGPTLNPALHDHQMVLFGTGLYREKFYTANMVYGFGTREYIATGYKAELVGGYSWGEFNEHMYMGISYTTGGFRSAGYFMGGFRLGSFIDPETGAWHQSVVDVDLKWFSNLWRISRTRIRQFLAFNYTQGWNRSTGNDEIVRFIPRESMHALTEHVTGSTRAVLNTESVFFTPYQPLGFRVALFGFADFGLLGYSPNAFRNAFFTSFGVGVRLKNERLIFNTIQIRLGIAFSKNGLAESEFFRVSNQSRIEELRYRPTRPEVVLFE